MKVSDEHLDCLLKFLVDLEINKSNQSEIDLGNEFSQLSLFDEVQILKTLDSRKELSFSTEISNGDLFKRLGKFHELSIKKSLHFYMGSQKVKINNQEHYVYFKQLSLHMNEDIITVSSLGDFIKINPLVLNFLNIDDVTIKTFYKKIEDNNWSLIEPLGSSMLGESFRKLLGSLNLYEKYYELNLQDKKGFVLLDSEIFKLNKG